MCLVTQVSKEGENAAQGEQTLVGEFLYENPRAWCLLGSGLRADEQKKSSQFDEVCMFTHIDYFLMIFLPLLIYTSEGEA